ncbi:MAG: peptidylprolyl isomerase [Deltaproteobacteria bacterium]|nr:peptidylprolyl isomerase [Deltaproteobacteria bacterium]
MTALFPFLKLLLFCFPFLLSCAGCQKTPESGILARVNGEKIRWGDFRSALSREALQYTPEALSEKGALKILKESTLQAMIHEVLLLEAAEEEGIKISKKELSDALKKIESGHQPFELKKLLQQQKLSPEEWKERHEKKLTIEKFIDHLAKKKGPSEEEMKKEYFVNRGLYREMEKSHCRQIVASSEPKAEKILSLIQKGENFAAVAQEYSESPDRERGGDLGWVARGDLPPIMDEACFRFEPGETSGVVRSAYGYHIFRVIARRPARNIPFNEAKSLIQKEWREKKRDEILRGWLEKKRKNSKIEINQKMMENAAVSL